MIEESKQVQMSINVFWGILLTALFMFVAVLALVYAFRFAAGRSSISVMDLVFILLGTAAGGFVGVRVARLGWRQAAGAALLSAIALIIYSRFESSFPGPWIAANRMLDFASGLTFLVLGSAGVFFLPLFDPIIRQEGPAPALGKVALVAITLTVLAILVDYLIDRGSFFGLLTLVFGSLASAVLAGLGMILVLVNRTAVGAWLGGLGLVLEAFIVLAWWLLGSPWFP